jgi:hypothetical protein
LPPAPARSRRGHIPLRHSSHHNSLPCVQTPGREVQFTPLNLSQSSLYNPLVYFSSTYTLKFLKPFKTTPFTVLTVLPGYFTMSPVLFCMPTHHLSKIHSQPSYMHARQTEGIWHSDSSPRENRIG